MPDRTARRVLLIGWDAADWIVIDRLLARGAMPNLRRLIDHGSRADLGTLEPKLSPLLWSSIATGKTADKHGILNFVEPKPDGSGLRVSSSTSRKCKAIWNILSQAGLRTNVVGWYASHPAEPIRGSVTTNLLHEGEPAGANDEWPLPQGTVHPAHRAEEIRTARQRAKAFPPAVLKSLVPSIERLPANDPRIATLRKLMASAIGIERAAIAAMRDAEPWDLTMVFFDAIDTTGHHFMQYRRPRMAHVEERDVGHFGDVMDHVYQWHDESLGRLLAAAGPETTVILLSDHGFHSGELRPTLVDLPPERRAELESSWHRPLGILVLSGPGIRSRAPIASPTILDVAPTALALLGLPAGRDWDGRVLNEVLTGAVPERIESWESVDGDAGLHPPDLRQDPFEAADALQQLVDLGYMAALPEDVQGQLELVRRESLFNLGVALMFRRRPAEAIPHFERLVADRPDETRYSTCLTNCLLSIGRFADAARVIDAFLSHEPESVEGRLLLAAALGFAGDSRAASTLASLASAAAARPELHVAIAGVHLAVGQHEQALRHYEAASRRNRRDPMALAGLARASLALGRFEDAANHALEALEISQAQPETHVVLGAALAWYGDATNAATSVRIALQHDPSNIDAHRWLAVIAEAGGDRVTGAAMRNEAARLIATAGERPADLPHGPAAYAASKGLAPV